MSDYYIRATINAIKADPAMARAYRAQRLVNALDNLDPDYDHRVGTVIRAELERRGLLDGLHDLSACHPCADPAAHGWHGTALAGATYDCGIPEHRTGFIGPVYTQQFVRCEAHGATPHRERADCTWPHYAERRPEPRCR